MKWWLIVFLVALAGKPAFSDVDLVEPEEDVTHPIHHHTAPARRNFHQALRTYQVIGSAVVEGARKLVSDLEHPTGASTSFKDLLAFPNLPNISHSCFDSLSFLAKYANHPAHLPEWMIRFLDAQPKPPSSILEGNIAWLGGFHQCMNLTAYENATNPTPETKLLAGKYCLVTVSGGQNVSFQLQAQAAPLMQIPNALRLGVCMPDTCSEWDIRELMEFGVEMLEMKYSQLTSENISIDSVKCPAKEIPMDGPAIGVIVVLVALATLVLIATTYDILVNGVFLENDDRLLLENSQTTSHYTTLVPADALVDAEHRMEIKEGRSLMARICLSLSLVSNTRRIFRCGPVLGELPWINGLRVLSMVWIILGQTYALGLPVYDNLAMLPESMKNLFSQIIIQSTFAVDTFLFLSGFLVAYRYLNELVGGFDCIRLIRFYVNRYVRLFPVYMVVLGIYAALTKYISSGPIWPQDEVMLGNCSHFAWTNAFYVNNYVQPEQMCMPWTWYIAIDFQLFIVAPLIVLLLSVIWKAGVALCAVCVLTAVIAAGAISKALELPPSLVGFGSTDASAFDQILTVKYFTHYLITAYCRAAPYFIGILAAFFLRDIPNVRKSGFFAVTLGWILAVVGIAIVIFSLVPGFNGHPLSVDAAAAFNSLSHVLWAASLTWIAYSCMTGAVKGVDRVLGWGFWRPLSAISYSVYLISPIVISVYYLSREETIRFSHWNALTLFGGNLLLCLLIGYLIYIFVEAPIRSLVRMVCRRCMAESRQVAAEGENKI